MERDDAIRTRDPLLGGPISLSAIPAHIGVEPKPSTYREPAGPFVGKPSHAYRLLPERRVPVARETRRSRCSMPSVWSAAKER